MIVKPSIAFSDFAGSAKDVTARNVKGRNILSSKAQHSKVVSPAQATSRNRLAKISRSYKKLSSVQMNGWASLAEKMKGISTFGQAVELTPHNAFVRINSNLQMVGKPLMMDAPAYINDVPEVEYDDLWISPDVIVFTGLQQPSDSHALVFKMSPALSPGVSSGWGQTVIITPGMAPDWGDADLTALYTSVMGVAPEAGKKYFCEFYWLDKNTGFTGESMAISAVCKESSTAYMSDYVPRARVTETHLAEGGQLKDLDLEFSPGSAICSADAMLLGHHDTAMSEATLVNPPANLPVGSAYILARATAENDYIPQTYQITIRKWTGEWNLRFSGRGGNYKKPSEVHGTAIFYEE